MLQCGYVIKAGSLGPGCFNFFNAYYLTYLYGCWICPECYSKYKDEERQRYKRGEQKGWINF